MSVWNYIILSGVAAAALVALDMRQERRSERVANRYIGWLVALSAAYLFSVIYYDTGLPYPEAFAFFCDAVVVFLICRYGYEVWEMRVASLFLVSAFVNMAYLAHNLVGANLVPHAVHGAVLEVINLAAIACIGFPAAFDRQGYRRGRSFDVWHSFLGFGRGVYQRRDPRA